MSTPYDQRRALARIALKAVVSGVLVAVTATVTGGLAAAHPMPSTVAARTAVAPPAPAAETPAAETAPTTTAAGLAPTTTASPVTATPTKAPPTTARPAPAPTTTMPPTTAAATTTTTARPQQHVVVFGDSVPAGTACDCGGFGANVASALAGALSNFAVPGLTTEGLLDQLNTPSAADALRSANVVLVTIGANDFNEADASDPSCSDLSCYSATMQTVTANVRSIVSQIKALAPSGTRILLTGYWNVFLDGQVGAANGPIYVDTSDALSRQLNSNLAQLSRQQGVLYTDVYTPFKGSGNVDDTGLLASDGDHPDVAGHRVIANAILATLHANG